MNETQIAEWRKRWLEIRTRGHLSDYDLACFYRDLVKAVGLAAANTFVSEKLGEGSSGVTRYGEMCGALEVVKDKAVWSAVGWRGVERILDVIAEDRRNEVCRRVVEAAKIAGGVVGLGDLGTLLKPYLLREGSSPPRAKGSSGMGPVRKADILTVEIRNLIDSGVIQPGQLSSLARTVVEEAFGPLTDPAEVKAPSKRQRELAGKV